MRLILSCLILAPLAYGAWEPIGPEGGLMRSTAISPSAPNTFYATTYTSPCRVYRSTNCGTYWTRIGTINSYTYCMAIAANDYLYCGSNGVYRSTDDGASWTFYSTGCYVFDLAPHPTIATTIYGAGYSGATPTTIVFLKSTDSGISWTKTNIASGLRYYGRTLAVDNVNPNNVYVGGNRYDSTAVQYVPVIYKSTDGGANFTEVYSATTGYYVFSLGVHPTNPDIVYAGTSYNGILRSTNRGQSWTKVSSLNYNYKIATSPASPDLVMIGSDYYIYRSTDAGLSWSSLASGLKGDLFYGLAIDRQNAAVVNAVNSVGFFRSTNTGSTWQFANTNLYAGVILDFGIAPSQTSTIYTEFEAVGVFKTTDHGSAWTHQPTPSTCGALCAFAVNNADPNKIFALEGTG